MTSEELRKRRETVEYHIDGQLATGVWENIENPGSIGWHAGFQYHRHFVAMCSNPNCKYKRMRLTKDSVWDDAEEPFVCIFKDRIPI